MLHKTYLIEIENEVESSKDEEAKEKNNTNSESEKQRNHTDNFDSLNWELCIYSIKLRYYSQDFNIKIIYLLCDSLNVNLMWFLFRRHYHFNSKFSSK